MNHSYSRWFKYWNTLLHYGLEEARLIKAPKDIGILYNKFTFLFQRTKGKHVIGDIPPSIQIEPTNNCNARCICCSTFKSTRKRGYMDFALFQKIVEDARRNNMKIVHLYLHGEPLLHPKIVEMIRCVKQHDLAVHLTTNGMLLTRDMSIAILNSGVDLADHFTFSILGHSKEVHELVMGKVNHEKVLNNLDAFLALRREMRASGPIIESIFYPMPENQHEAPAYLNTFKGTVDHARLASRISVSFANYGTGKEIPVANRRQSCSHVHERLTVFWNGDVAVCHNDINGDWVFGNLADQSIQDVCKNEKMLSLHRLHANRQFEKIPLCNQCDA